MGLVLAIFIGISRTVGREFGPAAGWAVFAGLAGALGINVGMTWRAQRRFAKQVTIVGTALDAGNYREALQTVDAALAFVIRAGALRKTGDNQAALEASARAFSCMCGVQGAHTQLTIIDQLGWLLLETGHARWAWVIGPKRRRWLPRAVWSGLGWHAYGSGCMQMQRPRSAKRSI